MASKNNKCDVLIIGSGAAGLSLALRLNAELDVVVLSKREITEGNTLYAQGGVSAVLDSSDSIESHIQDTLNAGAGICDEQTVGRVVRHGPENIRWLLDLGVEFTRAEDSESGYHLTREGGHTHRRIIHAADATGKEIETSLVGQVKSRRNIRFIENSLAIDLITADKKKNTRRCVGAYILDLKTNKVDAIAAKTIVLATGGASKVYLYTSNPDVATGDGIAMAWRAGCRVANMEFNQFHPTCLYHPKAKSFLITEAVRGEGGKLLLPDGTRFMDKFDDRGELAPRDIVARAIDHEMKRLGCDCLYLDISHKGKAFIEEHFPTIHARCLDLGIDITREAIPIVPAAHYTCGGIVTNQNAETDIKDLYAIGETAYTGLHGANRMASNSLLECLVFGQLAAESINNNQLSRRKFHEVTDWDESRVSDSDEEIVVSHNWHELRQFMWDYVGIVRSSKRLARARRRINLLKHEVTEYYSNFRVNNDLLELRNLLEVADLIVQSATRRKESRGLHYNLDFPETDSQQAEPTMLIPDHYWPNKDF
ncbi:MAG: L-aspartate oxidase [Gammaproteobacteria bacterium]|nr:L-aspartate oxidase [Gammaproteobacteria bacterium]